MRPAERQVPARRWKRSGGGCRMQRASARSSVAHSTFCWAAGRSTTRPSSSPRTSWRVLVLAMGGGPLVSLAVSTSLLAALTGSASGGLTIALEALGATYLARAAETGLDPALLHRVAVIGSGTLDILPHNGAVVTLLAVCGSTHREAYRDIVVVGIVGSLLALAAIIALGTVLRSF